MKRGRKSKPEVSPKIAAIRRLSDDGASSNAAIRKRIALIAAERKLPAAETKKVMGRLLTYDIELFVEKHHISVDWLIAGDLKGLLRTVRGCPSRPPQEASTAVPFAYTSEEFVEAMKQLDPKDRQFIIGYMQTLIDGGGAA